MGNIFASNFEQMRRCRNLVIVIFHLLDSFPLPTATFFCCKTVSPSLSLSQKKQKIIKKSALGAFMKYRFSASLVCCPKTRATADLVYISACFYNQRVAAGDSTVKRKPRVRRRREIRETDRGRETRRRDAVARGR